jgi:NTE family protein
MTAGREGRGGCETAFVLGGGSNPGTYGIGMLRALFEAGIRPDLVVGTSVGAVNAALVAAFPGAAAADRLVAVWNGLARTGVFGAFLFGRIGTAIRSGTHLYSSVPLRALLESSMPVAASIEPCGGGVLRRGRGLRPGRRAHRGLVGRLPGAR